MTHFIFDTEQEAISAEAQIVTNIRTFIGLNIHDALNTDGSIKSRRADNKQYSDGITSRWVIPSLTIDGQWVVLVPTVDILGPIPVELAIAGISAPIGTPTFQTNRPPWLI